MTIQSNFLQARLNHEPVSSWISAYKHEIKEDQVMVNGKYTPIEDIAKQILEEKKGKISSKWRYDHRGFVNESYIKFKELTPTHQHTPDDRFYVVIKSKERGFMGFSRHCYLELINNKGEGFSVGLVGSTSFPFNGTLGAIVSPDTKVASSGYERSTKIIVTEEIFNNVFRRITNDKKEGKEYFHLLQHNCSKFVSNLCRDELDIKIDNHEFISQVATRGFLNFLRIKPSETALKVLHVAAVIARIALAPLYALLYLGSGAFFDDKKGKEARQKQFKVDDAKPFIQKFFRPIYNFFSCKNLKIATGWKVSVWQDRVKEKFNEEAVTLEQARLILVPTHIAF
jgi:hypothetical protein